MIRIQDHIRAGRDATVSAWLAKAPPPRCPHSSSSKGYRYWQVGAKRAGEVIEQLDRIG